MTRAKESLILTFPQRLGSDPASPAPFLHEIGLQPEMAETEERPLTLGEVRTRLTRLSPEILPPSNRCFRKSSSASPAGASVHGIRPRSFTTHATDMIQLPEDYCFTASSLANYVDCPRRFFFLNILRIQDRCSQSCRTLSPVTLFTPAWSICTGPAVSGNSAKA